jgi:L-alanine-DL-glutamate epimerase-like enolase superfamily enzyme
MRLRIASCPFPFRGSFEHASAVREQAENVIAIAEDEAGLVGLGEGCPRAYVTGETVTSTLAAIARWREAGIENIPDLPNLHTWMERHRSEIDQNPSAFSAVELALIDVFARRAGRSLESLLGTHEAKTDLRTSAIYGSGSKSKFLIQVARFNLNGMRDAKLKINGDRRQDHWRVQVLSQFGRVRLDANNLWASPQAACSELECIRHQAWAIEEPLRPRDWQGLAEVGSTAGLAIILDESVTRMEDLSAVRRGPTYLLNARISKHGGLLRTLEIIEAARSRGMKIIVGSQVGETSILARAGILAASAAGSDLVGFEGAYGTRLLVRDATTKSIGFGYRGRVALAPSDVGSGLSPTAEVNSACG